MSVKCSAFVPPNMLSFHSQQLPSEPRPMNPPSWHGESSTDFLFGLSNLTVGALPPSPLLSSAYMVNHLGYTRDSAIEEASKLYYNHGTTLAGLVDKGINIDFDHWHKVRARRGTVVQIKDNNGMIFSSLSAVFTDFKQPSPTSGRHVFPPPSGRFPLPVMRPSTRSLPDLSVCVSQEVHYGLIPYHDLLRPDPELRQILLALDPLPR